MSIGSKLKKLLQEYKLYRINSGPYKFLLQKLDSYPSIDVASSIIESGYFRRNLVPLEINTTELKKIIVFAPHQDDEAIGCGGILSELSALEYEIHIVFLTDGDSTDKTMKEVRHLEATKSINLLNAKMHEINISNVDFGVTQENIQDITSVIDSVQPDAIFTTWVLDAPSKHKLCNVILNVGLKHSAYVTNALPVYMYQVHTNLIPNMYFDYTHRFEEKQKLIACHKSQMEIQNYKHLSAGLDAWNARILPWSEDERYVELYTVVPKEAFSGLVGMYEQNVNDTFDGNPVLIQAYNNLMKSEEIR